MNCRNCNIPLTGKFCADCGRPVHIERVNWQYIVHEIRHVLHFEKGLGYTVRELVRNPGPSIQEFITVDRSRLVKPVLFLVVTSLIYSTLEHFFHIEQGYIDTVGTNQLTGNPILNWIQNHYGYVNIMMAAFIAFWLKLMFRKSGYNYFEILIMLCFVMGMGMLITTVFVIFQAATGLSLMVLSGVIAVCYCTWAIGHFFDRKRVTGYLKAFASYLLGMISFSVSVILLVILVEVIKH